MFRIGLGKDLHTLVPRRRFVLGGVEIPFEKGEEAHSDGDVLAHALIDALLGAAALGDIGELFPDTSEKWKDASSIGLLRTIKDRLDGLGWKICNIDAVVECEKPKILPYRTAIRESLAGALAISAERVFVKGKTAEGFGGIGMGTAVSAEAVCLLFKKDEEN